MSRRVRSIAVLATLALHASFAHAGNVDPFYLSNDAAVQAGAITADVKGGGSIWYNPAGLATLPGLRLDVSASAYALRLGGQPDVSVVGEGSSLTRLTSVDLQIVPTALTLTHKFGDVGVGFGVFVPSQQTTFLRTHAVTPRGDNALGVEILVDSYEKVQEYYAGPSFGLTLHKLIDFGGSLLVHYRNELATGASLLVLTGEDSSVRAVNHLTLDWQQVGAQAVLGLQLRPLPDWRIGFAVRTPSLRLLNIRQTVRLESFQVSGEFEDPEPITQFEEDFGISSAYVAPMRFHMGTSHQLGPTRLAFELNGQAPLRSKSSEVETKAVVNARVGVRHDLDGTLALGGGLYTDLSPERRADAIGERKIDYYGATIAVDLTSPYGIVRRGDQQLSSVMPLLFGTTLALSYAVGFGELVQAEVGSAALLTGVETDLVVHELTLHFGSSLAE